MKKTFLILVLVVIIFIYTGFITAHAADVVCPECGSSNVEVVSRSATCTEGGWGSFRCRNTSAEEHSSPVSGDFVNLDFRQYEEALGHKYVTSVTKKATCLSEGEETHTCSRCGDSYTKTLAITGHSYKTLDSKDASCEEDGYLSQQCTVCNKKNEKIIKALGHNYKETENIAPTCTEDGHITTVCKNCKDEQIEVISALGHEGELAISKEASCEEEGIMTGICSRCNEEYQEIIEALGHDYPEDWTIEKDANIFSEGLKTKTCALCDNVMEETIPKEEIPVPVYIGGSVAAIASIVWVFVKKAGASAVSSIAESELIKPSFEDKVVISCLKEDKLYNFLKIQKHIQIIETEYDELSTACDDNEASLVLIDICEKELSEFEEMLKAIKEEHQDLPIAILLSREQFEQKELLEKMKEEELISGYACIETNAAVNFIRLVLPAMKPDLKSDEALENIGMIADALGIPMVSGLIDTYISGREVKETIFDGEEGMGFVDTATIITDIASIMGLDKVSEVAGLVVDLDDIKSALEAKTGGYELGLTKDAITDIADVFDDLTE